ncbi:MAG TPA: DNA polymerase III subunit chi [Rhodopila sp.]|uniref:DNA polymerase III subunit chi n=1 Tax=Rhodopila sp. TaxID=2480087 RepID=UPI002C143D8F|nr:DNA polymerase III subunit chi [Rhodopila sp.]HVY13662.1 DNA polymerase III subunit chi [Rhodopila sp.]
MTEVGFYHLTRTTLTDALPRLLGRTLDAGQRALVVGSDQKGLDAISTALWAQEAWLPHGGAADGDADLQPIWLSLTADPVNAARYLFLVQGAQGEGIERFERVFDLFDGTSEPAVAAARDRWRALKEAGHALAYWQQTSSGWQKKV